LYVLPYGQMSLWGATVITNLMSAIPWVGQDIVEFLKIIKQKSLDTIGVVHKNALKRGKFLLKIDKKEYLSIPSSFIAFLVGLLEGDGYIQITKTGKGFIAMKLVISLHLKDLATLEYIRSVLKLGSISIYKDNLSPTCKLIINKTDLQEVFFPLLLYHNIYFLTNTRITQFNTAMYILKNDIKNFNDIPSEIPNVFELPSTAKGYTELPFFLNWIVGFTMAEGSFFIKSNNDGCFTLTQRLHIELFQAIKLVFFTTRKLENSTISRFSVSSKSDIQTVINFFSFSGLHPLVGLKNAQYLIWLEKLNNSERYKNLNYPPSVL
jgi:hypothetical protein